MSDLDLRDEGGATRLHGLFALLLAACVAIGAIAAAVAILDSATRPSSATSAMQAVDSAFGVEGGTQRDERRMNRQVSTTDHKRRR